MTENLTIMVSASYADSVIKFRLPLIEELIRKGFKVIILSPKPKPKDCEFLAGIGCILEEVKLDRNKIRIFSDIIYLFQLILYLFKHKPGALISYTAKPNIYGALAASMFATKTITLITGLGTNFVTEKFKLSIFIYKILLKIALILSDLVILQNNDDYDFLVGARLLSSKKHFGIVNGSGVDTNYFYMQPLPENLSFLMLSRFLKSKGIVEYLEAAKLMKLEGFKGRFILAGPNDFGSDRIARQDLLEKFGNYVEILDEVEDVRALIRNCSVYVLPSYREGTPRSVLEAMATGRAIVTTDVPGCKQTVIQGENGLLVEVKNISALVAALKLLAGDVEKVKSMGRKSRELAEIKYDASIVKQQYLNFILSVMNERF